MLEIFTGGFMDIRIEPTVIMTNLTIGEFMVIYCDIEEKNEYC